MKCLLLLFALLCLSKAQHIPSKSAGVWYYIADGNTGSHPYNPVPNWLLNSGNTISLAFMNPADFLSGNPVPQIFNTTATFFKQHGKTVFYTIGGEGYSSNWQWLQNNGQASQIGGWCAQISMQLGVGIEIDYEGGADPTQGLTAFVQGFRSVCPVGRCILTMDLYGSPGGQFWQTNVVKAILPPNGVPGDRWNNGNHLDYVNIMVIDGQPVQTAIIYWKQWMAAGLTMSRATFGIIAGWPGLGICLGNLNSQTDEAWSFLSPENTYGLMSWAVCPHQSCGDWNSQCDSNAPGFNYMCNKVGAC